MWERGRGEGATLNAFLYQSSFSEKATNTPCPKVCRKNSFMLNLFVMIRNFFLLWVGFWIPLASGWYQISRPKIDSPGSGDAVQGVVSVMGTSDVVGFQRMETAFAYGNKADTWFLIEQSEAPVRDGTLAMWDTTTIADGMYLLRVRVQTVDGQTVDVIIRDLRVRNYTPVETNTPPPQAMTTEPETAAPVSTTMPSPTPLAANPASVTVDRLGFSAVEGVMFVGIGFFIVGIYNAMRRKKPRR